MKNVSQQFQETGWNLNVLYSIQHNPTHIYLSPAGLTEEFLVHEPDVYTPNGLLKIDQLRFEKLHRKWPKLVDYQFINTNSCALSRFTNNYAVLPENQRRRSNRQRWTTTTSLFSLLWFELSVLFLPLYFVYSFHFNITLKTFPFCQLFLAC